MKYMRSPVPSLDLFTDPSPGSVSMVDNHDPHPVILTVYPRETLDGVTHEAEYEIDVDHPSTCSQHVEECPVADYLDVIGIDRDLYAGFPEPDYLSDQELAVLNGTVRYVAITRSYTHHSGPYGDDWDVEYEFEWSDGA
jgi:hypothetical protein